MNPIIFSNAGQAIKATNYWQSEHARSGLVYLSWNAGAGRLLVPMTQLAMLAEMETAKYVIVSRGPASVGVKTAEIELLFEDDSETPFSIQMSLAQCDRIIPASNEGGGFDITVWTETGEQMRFPGKYRIVKKLPCLKPWGET